MEIRDFGQDEWNGIVSDMGTLSLMQTWEFGEAKALTGPWKVSRSVFRKDDDILGAAQVMIRTIPFLNRGLVWVNRAPLFKNSDIIQSDVYIDMLSELKKYWVDKKNMYLRIAPPLMAIDENYAIFEKVGYLRTTKTDGWVSEIVDLSRSTEELHKGLQRNWRRNLKKAESSAVICEIGTSVVLVDEVLDDYKMLLNRRRFNTNLTPEFIRTMQNLLPNSRKMPVFVCSRKDKEVLGSILIATYGNTCMSLIGTIYNPDGEVGVNHYLIWNAICEMKKRGFMWFDVGGAHPNNTLPGILYFKRGLNGKQYSLMGEVDSYNSGFLSRMIKKRIESER